MKGCLNFLKACFIRTKGCLVKLKQPRIKIKSERHGLICGLLKFFCTFVVPKQQRNQCKTR
ncbi:MAG: hypothetical protein LBL74_03470 [Bacteroidales bacterium]|nr:hypothetical protein [Bacteroidales bacterium]